MPLPAVTRPPGHEKRGTIVAFWSTGANPTPNPDDDPDPRGENCPHCAAGHFHVHQPSEPTQPAERVCSVCGAHPIVVTRLIITTERQFSLCATCRERMYLVAGAIVAARYSDLPLAHPVQLADGTLARNYEHHARQQVPGSLWRDLATILHQHHILDEGAGYGE